MPLSPREQQLYDRLRAKKGGSGSKTPSQPARRTRTRERDDEDEGIFVLSGRHANTFLDRMFGPSPKATEPDDDDLDDDDFEDEDLDDEDDDEEEIEPDPPSARGHKYFTGGSGGRG